MYTDRRRRFLDSMGKGAVAILQGARLVARSNDTDFPSVRRVGLNIGVDGKSVGFELMANDLAALPPEIFGGRFYKAG